MIVVSHIDLVLVHGVLVPEHKFPMTDSPMRKALKRSESPAHRNALMIVCKGPNGLLLFESGIRAASASSVSPGPVLHLLRVLTFQMTIPIT